MAGKKTKIVVVGGGTGTFVVLSGLKAASADLNITAIVTMMDSGGSTGRLRDQYGVLPPGDIRQALVALSDSDELWRKLFLYRFEEGDFKGHNFGNIFLAALERISGSFQKALYMAQEVLQTQGSVIPVTLKQANIVAHLTDGTVIHGERLIDEQDERAPIARIALEESVDPNPEAAQKLLEADIIVVGPGDIYTSILPNFLFPEVATAYQSSHAQKIYIANLMNKKGQTDNYTLQQYLDAFKPYLGEQPFDAIIVNTTPVPHEQLTYYKEHGETPIINDLSQNDQAMRIITGDLLSPNRPVVIPSDVARSMVRHDPHRLAKTLLQLIHDAAPYSEK